MPKINQEEYEVLKGLDDKWKWIARDEDEGMFLFVEKPYKHEYFPQWRNQTLDWKVFETEGFQFIQWEDESPYNIQELIEEYEIETGMRYDFGKIKVVDIDTSKLATRNGYIYVKESEEKEVKDLEWVKAKLKKDHKDGEMARSQIKDGEKIDGIDLNSYWRGRQTANYIARCYLEDLDEPEVLSQELPVIPKFVAEWIEEAKGRHHSLYEAMADYCSPEMNQWIQDFYHSDLFAKAWLAYPNIEIEQEPRYYAKIKGHENIGSNDKYWNYNTDMEELSVGDSEVHPNVISEYMLKATKDEWANLGINDDNAEFELVEELKEC